MTETDIGQKTLQMLEKWENGMGFSREMISLAADEAYEAKKPISYMDKLLQSWAEKGIKTAEAAKKEQKAHGEQSGSMRKDSVKNVPAQQYTQRDYEDEQDEAVRRMISGIANGGKHHA